MQGKAIIIVGAPGSGKTTISKRLIANVHESRLLIFDVNCEYGDYLPDDYKLPDIDEFLSTVANVRERFIVFEEATIFFSNRSSNAKIRKILVEKRHTQNIILLNFHSIRYIPYYIYDLVNYVFVLKTNDAETLVKAKHERLLSAFLRVQKMPPTRYPNVSAEIVKIS